uniref:Transposase n=1 Tax=Ascaris lumbricoides TaxID=6252 RepID=A0A0M3INE6_ASCLU
MHKKSPKKRSEKNGIKATRVGSRHTAAITLYECGYASSRVLSAIAVICDAPRRGMTNHTCGQTLRRKVYSEE